MPIESSRLARASIEPTSPFDLSRLALRPVGAKDRMFFLEQLTLLLETGVTLHAALQALRKECPHPTLAAVLDAMVADIAMGRSFSAALERHPRVFSPTYAHLAAASETGGFMPDVLKQLLQMEERREKLRSTVFAAAAYPAFLTVFSFAVVVFVLVVVFPQFAGIFARIEQSLPLSTKVLMWCSAFLRANWIACLAVGAIAFGAVRGWAASEAGSELLDALKLRAPVIGGVFVKLYLVQSLRPLSLSLGNGVGAVEALQACQEVVANRVFRRFFAGLRRSVEQGETLAAGFAKAEFIPPLVRQLIATGDESGNLAKVMGRVAEFYERELEKQLALLSRLAEPVMLLVMGALVGLIVSSLILPIFSLSRGVG